MGMSWYKRKPGQTPEQQIRGYLESGTADGGRFELVDLEITEEPCFGELACYALLRKHDAEGQQRLVASVLLAELDGDEIGFKEISEFEGPHYYGCPERILAQLPPTESPASLKWRELCRSSA